MSNLRQSVISSFKQLHRTRLKVFEGDTKALSAARLKINEEYRKNKNVTDKDAIKAMVQFGLEVENELRTQIIQAREVKPGVFEAKITQDTIKLNNIPFNASIVPDEGIPGGRPCCQGEAKKQIKK